MEKRGRPRTFHREEALTSAMLIFWERGYSGTSMAKLTEGMKLNATSIYAAFGSKENLFFESVELYQKTAGAAIWEAVGSAESSRLVAEALVVTSAVEFTRPSCPQGCLVILAALFSSGDSDAVHPRLKNLRFGRQKFLVSRFKEAFMAEGIPVNDSAPDWDALARYYLTVQQGMAIQARDGASRSDLTRVAASAMASWDNLVGGVRA